MCVGQYQCLVEILGGGRRMGVATIIPHPLYLGTLKNSQYLNSYVGRHC